MEKLCNHCICKTCLIAEVNGGAPGCGDCYKCLNNDYEYYCNKCSEYYNTDSPKGLNLAYLLKKKKEEFGIEE